MNAFLDILYILSTILYNFKFIIVALGILAFVLATSLCGLCHFYFQEKTNTSDKC